MLPAHRQQEFVKFLNEIDAGLVREPGVEIHLILDNYGTHKAPSVKRWFERHPEYHLHFTPTSGSWLNQVERFFGKITEKAIRRGVFRSVPALEKAIMDYLADYNENPRPFVWTADAELILNRVQRVCERISNSPHYALPNSSLDRPGPGGRRNQGRVSESRRSGRADVSHELAEQDQVRGEALRGTRECTEGLTQFEALSGRPVSNANVALRRLGAGTRDQRRGAATQALRWWPPT